MIRKNLEWSSILLGHFLRPFVDQFTSLRAKVRRSEMGNSQGRTYEACSLPGSMRFCVFASDGMRSHKSPVKGRQCAVMRNDSVQTIWPFLSTKEAARHLNLSPRTLEAMRVAGRGPTCRRHGRLWRYRLDELERWSDRAQLSLRPAK